MIKTTGEKKNFNSQNYSISPALFNSSSPSLLLSIFPSRHVNDRNFAPGGGGRGRDRNYVPKHVLVGFDCIFFWREPPVIYFLLFFLCSISDGRNSSVPCTELVERL